MTPIDLTRCAYVWKHKGRLFVCGYKAMAGNRCLLHVGHPGELGFVEVQQ